MRCPPTSCWNDAETHRLPQVVSQAYGNASASILRDDQRPMSPFAGDGPQRR